MTGAAEWNGGTAAPDRLDRAADFLFRHRGLTAAPFALALLWLARPGPLSLAAGLPVVAAGQLLRLWAASHIGGHARGRRPRAPRLVQSGPYALLRHPLYAGNALLCAGFLLMARAGWPWFPPAFGMVFIAQYALFVRREERLLRAAFGPEWADYSARAGRWWPRAFGFRRAPLAPLVTRAGFRLEWPTVRTVLALAATLALLAPFRPN